MEYSATSLGSWNANRHTQSRAHEASLVKNHWNQIESSQFVSTYSLHLYSLPDKNVVLSLSLSLSFFLCTLSCAPQSRRRQGLSATVTPCSSQWLENHKRDQWALSFPGAQMLLHWLTPGVSRGQLLNFAERWAAALPQDIRGSSVYLWNEWRAIHTTTQPPINKPHPSLPCLTHPSPSASRQTLCRSLYVLTQSLNKRITLLPPRRPSMVNIWRILIITMFFKHHY